MAEIYGGYARSERRRRAWSADNPGNVAIRDELFDRVVVVAREQLAGDGRILDAGCGTGYWLERLTRHGVIASRLAGVDLLADRLGTRESLSGVELRVADVRSLPYAAAEFKLVLMLTVLSSMPAREDVLLAAAEAVRVLSPGGMLLVYEPRIPNPLNRATRVVRASDLEPVLGQPQHTSTLTLAPALARRLGRRGIRHYDPLVRPAALRTHRLSAWLVE